MLYQFIAARHDEIVARASLRVAARRSGMQPLTAEQLQSGIPLFLKQLVSILQRADGNTVELEETAALYGKELLRMGFTVAQVVNDYGDVCQVVAELADASNTKIDAAEYRLFNASLDVAIAQSVTEYMRQREQTRSMQGTEQTGLFAHELRNLLNSAVLSFALIKKGQVPLRGSTARVLERSFTRMRDLVDRTLAEVRLEAHGHEIRQIGVAELFEDVEISAALDAKSRSVQLMIGAVDADLFVSGDLPLLASALNNLLQNAFKFTSPNSTVTLRARVEAERVLMEIEDRCGGLPRGKAEELFQPFAQSSANRTGLGLGLMIARRAVEACGGTLYVRNLPGTGCVFTIDLPKLATSARPAS